MGKLEGRNALITGASTGIGRAVAVRFAAEGANVVINYNRSADEAEQTRAMSQAARKGAAGRELVIQGDVGSEDDVLRMFGAALAAFGRIDILVNNAGIQKPTPSHELSAADFDRVVGVNLRGTFLCSREALKHFLSRPGGGVGRRVALDLHAHPPPPRGEGEGVGGCRQQAHR